jgi:hypothetical protein
MSATPFKKLPPLHITLLGVGGTIYVTLTHWSFSMIGFLILRE